MLTITNHQGNADQNHNETELLTLREKKKRQMLAKICRKGNPGTVLVGVNRYCCNKKSTEISQKITNRTTTTWSSNSTSGHLSKGIEIRISERYTYMHAYVHCPITTNVWSTLNVHWRTNKENVEHVYKSITGPYKRNFCHLWQCGCT